MNSIKFGLFIYYCGISFVIFGILGVFLYFSLEDIVLKSIDNALMTRAKAIATLISEDEGVNFQFSDEILKEYSKNSKHYFQVMKNAKIIEKSASLHNYSLPFVEGAKTIDFRNEPVRIVPFSFTIKNQQFTIECAQDIDDKIDLLQTYLVVLSIAIVAAIFLSALGGLFVVNAMLKPLKEISHTIGKLSESNLSKSRIDENVAFELKPLAVAFNKTFARLDTVFSKQKQFVADVSHELKTPLSVILMETEMALRKQRSIDELTNTINQIKDSALYMKNITETLLKLISIENTHYLEKKRCDIKVLIEKSVSLLRQQMDKKNIDLKINGETFFIEADETLIMEAFLNLIDNAIKYNKDKGDVYINIYAPEKAVEIIDTGFGIEKEALDKIFDKFYRADPSRSKTIEGLGLGLSLVKEILDLHKAKIEIQSTPNIGTKVKVIFVFD
ncbi:sensor histidine kinase [Calditerrivibrio nitroreducens]|uniref:histidine kinase n=1 Tax=Calditerrivibrio nitroreducens (strain DSM 19672 / NBRC 101217 / Yu37-1) TaxID=768670 RepID=E4TIV0_CALNY|nr:ATP-binding protein [Calditerrivibrio nitroreducens]ADR18055.1 integral membrane sensor signal transduction histidine kinase [Calditerrivibrio nitroreducens DSM 19672]